ncbi:uncharacterized protein A1O9_02064 [Exophiala aquamarina CBS 119918]|uniref:NmrA-like domain-containing protein n=1 Tax=Exophiala aquamarina CBS 119918 TaxID=1182545 RepID=A0A072PMD7_9EURO|nr:uncharacterized protein A1O9_02064 [Exophiala aquamarina CBS 119918]KEF60503.1 hypothetical protein A1O9_02064 [Exophiala aquamarina CBS 119918]
MSKLVVILGATGKQVGSVVDALLRDPGFSVRAVVRDTSSAAATTLQGKGVEIVQGNLTDLPSLVRAFRWSQRPGNHGSRDRRIYCKGGISARNRSWQEYYHGSRPCLRDTEPVHHFGSLSSERAKFQQVPKNIPFRCKGNARTNDRKRVSKACGENCRVAAGDVCYQLEDADSFKANRGEKFLLKIEVKIMCLTQRTAIRWPVPIQMPCSVSTQIPFIDPNKDPAIFLKALASQALPLPAQGRKIRHYAGYAKMITFEEWVILLNHELPIEIYYEQVSMEDWAREVTIIPGIGKELAEMWNYCENVGYVGGETGHTRKIT